VIKTGFPIKKVVPEFGTTLVQFSVEALELQECIGSCQVLRDCPVPGLTRQEKNWMPFAVDSKSSNS